MSGEKRSTFVVHPDDPENLGGLPRSFVDAEEARLAKIPGSAAYCRYHCFGDGHAEDCPRGGDRCRECGVELGAGYLCDECDTVVGWDE